MDYLELGITDETTIAEAIEIFKKHAESIANSEEALKYYNENPSWSKLFREEYNPYKDALALYENAVELDVWLNGKNSKNSNLTIRESFLSMSDQQRLTLFVKRIGSDVPTLYDDWLKAWWSVRY